MSYRIQTAAAIIAGVFSLAACGGSEPAADIEDVVLENGLTATEQVELRQEQLKKIGKAFKTISDELKAGDPDVAVIQEAAASVVTASEDMDTWFPEGSGPDSGVKTDALPAIWQTPEDFQTKTAEFITAAGALDAAAESGDIAAIAAAFQTTGGTCKSCHDSYRLDD